MLSTALVFSSCDNDDDDFGPNRPTTANMEGKINGEAFSWTGDAQVLGDVIQLRASQGLSPRITLTIPSSVVLGSYEITSSGNYKAVFMNKDGVSVTADTGTITITEYDSAKKTIKGTFNFSTPANVITPAYSITDGTFNFVYEILF